MTSSALPQLLRPRALRPGDLVVIASLSGPLPAAYEPNIEQTVVVLERMGLRVRRAPLLEVGRRHWWSAATPAEITGELNGLLRAPEVRAIVASDGGQTALGYLDLIDVEAIRSDPKPILGYSDISLLHLVLYSRTGLVGFHADMAVPGFGGHWQSAPVARQAELEKLYSRLLTGTEAIGALPASPSWECWRPGRVEGRLIGGVINRIVLTQSTRFALPLEWFDGAVLFWEEMGGLASYVWSYLQVMRHCGILDRISGMVVGVPRATPQSSGPQSMRPGREMRAPKSDPRRADQQESSGPLRIRPASGFRRHERQRQRLHPVHHRDGSDPGTPDRAGTAPHPARSRPGRQGLQLELDPCVAPWQGPLAHDPRAGRRTGPARQPGRQPAGLRSSGLYHRKVVERCFNRMKRWRGIATRHDKPLSPTKRRLPSNHP
ncbi:LD-carboxypeptidase [Streptomyces pratensis]